MHTPLICTHVQTLVSAWMEQVAVIVLKDAPIFLMSAFVVLWFTYKMIYFCFWKRLYKKTTSIVSILVALDQATIAD